MCSSVRPSHSRAVLSLEADASLQSSGETFNSQNDPGEWQCKCNCPFQHPAAVPFDRWSAESGLELSAEVVTECKQFLAYILPGTADNGLAARSFTEMSLKTSPYIAQATISTRPIMLGASGHVRRCLDAKLSTSFVVSSSNTASSLSAATRWDAQ